MRAIRLSIVLLAIASPAAAQQQILLDKQARGGDLVFLRDLTDEKAWYYVVDKAKLATDANGRPQFSFLRYVENQPAADAAAAAREGEGGGIVHALVSLSVSREQLQAAQRELQRSHPGAQVKGPVMFKTGQFGLVSSFKDPAGKLVSQVLGIGIAPLLDGEKAAISLQLPRLGAKVLWESFQTAAPDISFNFAMEVPGYMSPKRALVEANWDQIYQHKAFAAGVASKYLGAEIKAAFDDLTRSGAIKVTQIGADEGMQALLTTAYNSLTTLMFAAVTETGAPSAGGQSLLEKATAMYQNNEKAAIEERDKVRTANESARKHNAELEKRRRVAEDAERAARLARDRADAEKAKVAEARKLLASDEAAAGRLRKAAEEAGARATKLEAEAGDDAARKEAAAGARTEATALGAKASEADAKVAGRKTALAQAEASAAPLATAAETGEKEAAAARAAAPTESEFLPVREEPSGSGGFAAIVTYEMKKSRQSGRYTVDLNKYTADSLTLRFDENIGDLRSLLRDTAHFRQVNLDDPLYRQRELAVFVDGQNAKDFGDYINFVSVQMRKRHQGGDVTIEEVRIDRTNFNKEANRFRLLYGWKGDSNRQRWHEYEYQAVWSFFGGHTMEMPWVKASADAILLAPPLQRRSVALEGDPKRLTEQGVRSVTVKIFYKAAQDAPEQVKQLTLSAAAPAFAGLIEFVGPRNLLDYDYEIAWRLTGNREVTSGRQKTSSTILELDDVPKATGSQ